LRGWRYASDPRAAVTRSHVAALEKKSGMFLVLAVVLRATERAIDPCVSLCSLKDRKMNNVPVNSPRLPLRQATCKAPEVPPGGFG